jgi:hypothetical protein
MRSHRPVDGNLLAQLHYRITTANSSIVVRNRVIRIVTLHEQAALNLALMVDAVVSAAQPDLYIAGDERVLGDIHRIVTVTAAKQQVAFNDSGPVQLVVTVAQRQ